MATHLALLGRCPVGCLVASFDVQKPSTPLHARSSSCRPSPVRCQPLRVRATAGNAQQVAYKAPSSRTGATELDWLRTHSQLVPDTVLMTSIESLVDSHKPTAASVTSSVLSGILANPTSQGLSQYQAAIQRAMRYDKCSPLLGDDRLACTLVAAMCSLGALISESVPGRISLELDPRLAYDTDGLVRRGKATQEQFEALGVSSDRMLIRIPGTWEGIQAAKTLEQAGISTHVILIYSFVQAVAAAQAGSSVIQPNVGHIGDWFAKNPGAIRDPRAPRQDGGSLFGTAENPAIKLVERIYNYCKQTHPDVNIMAAGVRNKQEALALAGVDYIVLSPRVLDALSQAATLQGYNDGLRVDGTDSDTDWQPSLSPANAKEAAFSPEEIAPVTKQLFQEGLGQVGLELLDAGVQRLVDDIQRLERYLNEYSIGIE